MLTYRRETETKVLITYSFSLYLIVSSAELYESAQFLKSNCVDRCMELFRITLGAGFSKTPLDQMLPCEENSKQAGDWNYPV